MPNRIGAWTWAMFALDDASIPQPDIVLTIEPDGCGPIPLPSVR